MTRILVLTRLRPVLYFIQKLIKRQSSQLVTKQINWPVSILWQPPAFNEKFEFIKTDYAIKT